MNVLFRPYIEGPLQKIFSGFNLDPRVQVDEARVKKEHLELLRRLVGYVPDRLLKLAGGRDHYLYKGMHPDNQLVLNLIARALSNNETNFQIDYEGDFDPRGSFVCLGGPISNLRTASFLGYRHIDPKRPHLGFRQIPKNPLRLPVQFELDAEKLRKRGLVASKSIHDDRTPEWAIRIGAGDEFIKTKAGEEDYLLISRIPNWLQPKFSRHGGQDIVTVFAGCHSAGMNSVRLLLENLEILKRLDGLTSHHKFWQALIRVQSIETSLHPITGTLRHQAATLNPHPVAYMPVNL